jgi:hypothetical protein
MSLIKKLTSLLFKKSENDLISEVIANIEELIIKHRKEAVRAVSAEKQIKKMLDEIDVSLNKLEKIFSSDSVNDIKTEEINIAKSLLFKQQKAYKNNYIKSKEFSDRLKSDLKFLNGYLESVKQIKKEIDRRRNIKDIQEETDNAIRHSRELLNIFNDFISEITLKDNLTVNHEYNILKTESEINLFKKILNISENNE